MTRSMLKNLELLFDNETSHMNYQSDCLLQGVESKIYKPLMQRETCGKHLILLYFILPLMYRGTQEQK